MSLADARWERKGYQSMKRILAVGLVLLAVVGVAVLAGSAKTASAKPQAGSLVGTGATFFITLPLITPVLFFNLVMGLISAAKVFDSAYVFGSTGGAGAARVSYALVPSFP